MEASNISGTLPNDIGAWTDITTFFIPNNRALHGSLPASIANWTALTYFEVGNNRISGGLLPQLPFAKMKYCNIFDGHDGGTNSFVCPWPHGATAKCTSFDGTSNVPITDADCTSPCTGRSTKLAVDQCIAWIKFYDATDGPNWLYCGNARFDPCACTGWDGKHRVCNNAGTAVVAVYVTRERYEPLCPPSLARTSHSISCSVLWQAKLTGMLPRQIGAWVDIVHFEVQGNALRGTVPASVSDWSMIKTFLVHHNALSGLLPALPFAQMTASGCGLLDNARGGSNLWSCPWPAGATDKCMKSIASGTHWVNITNADCDKCVGSSSKLPIDQCLAWMDFFDATGGHSWTYYITGQPFCRGTRADPCSCMGNDGTKAKAVCNVDNTTITMM